MKINFDAALAAISNLGGVAGTAKAAVDLVGVVVHAFDGDPEKQDALKSAYVTACGETDAALDRLDQAIADAKAAGQ